ALISARSIIPWRWQQQPPTPCTHSSSSRQPRPTATIAAKHACVALKSEPRYPVVQLSRSLTSSDARSKGSKIAFKTRSEVEVLDDGYRWRKYGKKMVKNSPNPRNYYRCSSEGCRVKKRVERDRDDERFVITTYDGVHNHLAPLPPRGCAGYSLSLAQTRLDEGSSTRARAPLLS
uniref:WRKY domain-containing protein n=1 Tax=Aegilops tauschii subsp. strangulata TaxID=200361 RepID=A0A453EZ49_AEGTS